ncbi:hypothetical protein P3X46_020746 [Hevea brasiliensis]|uniref:BZIP domain-containing protein n=1 Tax=Hevea brasiliensis TaxID=3981 RepID=A0ABQ9LF99_HEVBR|nr:protein FD [Hevea brasiliensis]KAJ9165935.1 hypothetical protein P3X46_020746 [Hevea brasiliensis]
MRSSPERNDNNSRISSSPSKSSSTCSSPSSHQAVNTSSARKSMEDVWKDINLTCLQECPASHTNHHPAFPAGVILQDFLVRPFNKDPPTHSSGSRVTDFLDSLAPRPATTLRLNSGSDLEILESNSVPRRPNNPQLHSHASVDTSSFGSSLFSPFGALGSSSVIPSICKKRLQENHGNSSDRRHKRMIKNRESAARSRARKQESLYLLPKKDVFFTSCDVFVTLFSVLPPFKTCSGLHARVGTRKSPVN